MQSISTVTQKGQITIPVGMRKRFAIQAYKKVLLVQAEDHIKIYPTKDMIDFAGFIKTNRRKSVLKAREEMEKRYDRF